MTGDTPQESGHTSGAESAEIQNPDPDDSPGYGTAAGEEKTVVADSGTASAWPPWLGAACPAGWFLSASGEAAPPETPGTEPARADAAQSAGPSPADQPGRAGTSERAGVFAPTGPSKLTGVPERDEPDPDGPGQPSADGWAEYSPAQDEAVPAEWTGRDDAAAPYAVADSGPDDGWYEDPQPTSVHQIPQRWSWQPEPLPEPLAEPWQDAPRAAPPHAGDWYEPGYEARQDEQGYEPQRAGTSQQAWQDEPPASRGVRPSGSRGRTGRHRGNRGSFLWSARRPRCTARPGDQGSSCHRGPCPGSTTRRGGPGGSSRRACGTSRESAGSRP